MARDTRDLDPSQDFTGEIELAIHAASHVVVCLTKDVRRRADSFVRREIAYALNVDGQRRHSRGRRARLPLVPLVFPGGELPVLISTWTALFVQSGEDGRSLDALAARLRSRKVPSEEPRYAGPPGLMAYLNALHEFTSSRLQDSVHTLLTLAAADSPQAVAPAPSLFTFHFTVSPVLGKKPAPAPAASRRKPRPRVFRSFAEAFRCHGERVLLLGPPGAGKTTTLLAFARDAAVECLADPSRPVPLLRSLSEWSPGEPIPEWARSPARGVDLADRPLLYLLDGLDELGGERPEDPQKPDGPRFDPRKSFLHALEEQLRSAPVVLTSRLGEYKEIGVKAALDGAVTVQPLSEEQIRAYLTARRQDALWDALRADSALAEMARTPLLLTLLSIAFEGVDAPDLARLDESGIFDRYIESRFVHELAKPEPLPFDEPTTRRLLGQLAAGLWNSLESPVTMPLERLRASLGEQAESFAAFGRRMHFLKEGLSGGIEFIHLKLRDFCAIPEVRSALQDHDRHRVLRAVRLLGAIGSRAVVQDLIQLLYRQEEKPGGELGGAHYHFRWTFHGEDDSLQDSLFRESRGWHLLEKPSRRTLALEIVRALGKLRDPAAVTVLRSVLRSRDQELNGAAEEALDLIGTPEARAAVAAWRQSLRP